MYSALLFVHSWLRWFALATVIVVLIRAMRGAAARDAFGRADEKWIKGAAHILTAQVMIGIVLYAMSPYIRGLLSNMGAAMRDRTDRLFAVEHGVIMIIVMALMHMSFPIAKKAKTDQARHARIAMFFGIALVLMGYAIPWMRPFYRLGL
jgi:hypothetical protein